MHLRKSLPAYPVYLALEGAGAFFFSIIATVNLVYQAEVAHLGPLQLVLVGTLLESVCLVFQIPTGLLADSYSRRLAVIAGAFLIGAGFVVEGAFPYFAVILGAQVIWGLGATLADGAQEAWIAGELGERNLGPIYLRGAQAAQAGTLLGAPISVALASIRLNLPVLIGGLLYVGLAGTLLLVMPERRFQAAARTAGGTMQALGGIFHQTRSLIRSHPLLLSILGVAAFYGMASEGFDRLWQIHLLRDVGVPALGPFRPVVWFGVITVVLMLLSIGTTELARRRLDTSDHRAVAWALAAMTVLRISAIGLFAAAGSFGLALAGFWLASALRRTALPIYNAWLAQSIDARVRATVLSASSMLDSLGQIGGGPLIGGIATAVSLRAAVFVSGLALSPALLLFARAFRHASSSEVVFDGVEQALPEE